jgi:hypothetical protein
LGIKVFPSIPDDRDVLQISKSNILDDAWRVFGPPCFLVKPQFVRELFDQVSVLFGLSGFDSLNRHILNSAVSYGW